MAFNLLFFIFCIKVEMNGRLNPTKATWMKMADCGGMILEEQPAKLAEAFKLFLQGMGYGEKRRICTTLSILFKFLPEILYFPHLWIFDSLL